MDKLAYVWNENTRTLYYSTMETRTKLLYVPHTSDMHYMNPEQTQFISDWTIVNVDQPNQ
jgi:hypothetical protein